jgi:hypothetical protein
MKAFLILLRRELALAWGNGGGPLLALAFYACVVTLLPLAAGRAPERLASLAPGIAWLALALAALLSLERLFERDFEDGALDLLALGPAPLEAVAVAKCLAHWLAAGAPLAFAAPIAALALGASPHIIPLLIPCALPGAGLQARRPAGGGDRPAALRAAGDLRRRRPGRPGRRSAVDRGPVPAAGLFGGGRGPGPDRHGGGVPERAGLGARTKNPLS